ncbi:hypothetical protein EV426DRAFT_684445 [Tirmania nivea]|nr:hypothetical protein EV426DRAFT_684445 [Tirmania nivea]
MSTRRSPSASREVRDPRQSSQSEEGVNALLQAAIISHSSPSESYTEKEKSSEHEASRTGDPDICQSTTTRKDRYTGPRPPRPQYTEEQEDAIRFHRDDLCMTWTQVMNCYNGLYDLKTGKPWDSRSISGLQSRYYRLLDIPVNHAKKQSKPRPDLGILVMKPHTRYWWMDNGVKGHAKNSTCESGAEEEYGASDCDEQENEATGLQTEVRVINTHITRKRKRGLGPGLMSASSCDAVGRSAGAKKRRGLGNKISAQNANEVNGNILQETVNIKMEAGKVDGGPEITGGTLEGKGSLAGGTVENASASTTGPRLAGYKGSPGLRVVSAGCCEPRWARRQQRDVRTINSRW